MNEEGSKQEQIHEALAALLCEDGEVLTGWIVAYEAQVIGERPFAGHAYGPEGLTTWRALGLVEWASRFSLVPDPEEDDE